MSDLILPLPPIDQIGFVVRDVDATLTQYKPLFGAFEVAQYDLDDVDYRGRNVRCTLKIATANSAGVEIEFIEVIDGEAYHREFLDQGRDGPHHIRFTVPDLDATRAQLAARGWNPVFGKRFSPDLAFVYLEDDRGRVVELFEAR
jgi:catechol 2,3-dioxygenase-like lactoylglutathione lyase family enzyme